MSRGRFRTNYLARDYDRCVIGAGKCQLDGPEPYVPLFGIVEFPSKGARTASWSWLTGRPMQVMSRPEKDFYLKLHTLPDVVEIGEQYALDPRVTLELAHELGVDHPAVADDPIVMSTDFVVTRRRQAALQRCAYAVKQASNLTERVLEKLAIERLYWTRRGIPWRLILDTRLPRVRVNNMRQVFDYCLPHRLPCSPEEAAQMSLWMEPHVYEGHAPLRVLARECDAKFNHDPGTALSVAFHSLVTRQWTADWDSPFLPQPSLLPKKTTLAEEKAAA